MFKCKIVHSVNWQLIFFPSFLSPTDVGTLLGSRVWEQLGKEVYPALDAALTMAGGKRITAFINVKLWGYGWLQKLDTCNHQTAEMPPTLYPEYPKCNQSQMFCKNNCIVFFESSEVMQRSSVFLHMVLPTSVES